MSHYACDGELVFPGNSTLPRATWTITDDGKRQACEQALVEQGYEVMMWDRRLVLPFGEAERFLQWLGDPTPGSAYNWVSAWGRASSGVAKVSMMSTRCSNRTY